jgi:hypothetical protein
LGKIPTGKDMTVTIGTIAPTVEGWSFAWTGPAAVDVYLRGVCVQRAITTSPVIVADREEPGCPDVEILDTGAEPPLGSPYAFLQWWRVPGADGYTVQEYLGAEWISVNGGYFATLDNDGYLTWQSEILEDLSTHVYRVAAMRNGAYSVAHSATVKIVRNPRPPACSATISTVDGAVLLTIDEDLTYQL